jgi:hypothetical protein
MIGFDLTAGQKEFQGKAQKFSREPILSVVAKHNREGAFPLEVIRAAYQEVF